MTSRLPGLRILDRYVVRQIAPPTALGFFLFMFILLMNFILQVSEMLIERGVDSGDVLRFIGYSLPHVAVLAVPMAVLLGGLIGFGRMSSDFEIVALRSAGISLQRLAVPVLLFAAAAWAVNSFLFLVVMPWGNQKLYRLQWKILTSSMAVMEEIKPRQFVEDIPGYLLYLQDIDQQGRVWRGVFIAETRVSPPSITLARSASPQMDPETGITWLRLEDGVRYAAGNRPHDVTVARFDSTLIQLYDQDEVPLLGDVNDERSMTLGQLLEAAREREAAGEPAPDLRVEIHKKFALPVACFVLGLVALTLGVSTRRRTKVSGFGIAVVVIILYYLFLQYGEQWAERGIVPPWLGMWWGNVAFVFVSLAMLYKKSREIDWGLADRLRELSQQALSLARSTLGRLPGSAGAIQAEDWQPRRFRFPRLLDLYVLQYCAGIYLLALSAFVALWGIFEYLDRAAIATVPELLPEYFKFRIVFITHQLIPIAALITVLATFSLMTKHNEVVAALSGGISLYRLVLPLLAPMILLTIGHYLMQENVLPYASRRAEEISQAMRPGRSRSVRQLQPWVYGEGDRVFHFADYDRTERTFLGLYVYHLAPDGSRLTRVEYSERAAWDGDSWTGYDGWRRYFIDRSDDVEAPVATPLEEYVLNLLPIEEDPEYFGSERRKPEEMTRVELAEHIRQLEQRGYEALQLRVDLYQKVAFPAITLVLAMVGIPFAFRSGRHGALYGVGIAIGLAVLFWIAFAVFRALGLAGVLPPVLAAAAPHLLFLSLGAYLSLGLRT